MIKFLQILKKWFRELYFKLTLFEKKGNLGIVTKNGFVPITVGQFMSNCPKFYRVT